MATEKRLIRAVDMKTAFREWFDNEDFRTINEMIDDVPTVDAVEVVRCKDCKYKSEKIHACTNVKFRGERIHIWVEPDDFCSYGERKDNDGLL